MITLVCGYVAGLPTCRALGSDAATALAGTHYLHWFLPSLALQFAMVSMGSALRGTGIVQPTMIVQVLTVILNADIGTGADRGLGHRPPAWAWPAPGSRVPCRWAVGVVLLVLYFHRLEKYVAFDCSAWRPQLATWGRLLRVGLPAGGEFVLMFIYMGVMYWIIRRFGRGRPGGIRNRPTNHAEHVPAGDGGGLRHRTHRRTKFCGREIRAGARNLCAGRR